ncbi:MAG TPA: hypothetical protein VF006_32695 [Longimicrobium sp.]
MSRVRIGSIAACFGILITTGGCSSSATAPEAATAERTSISADRATNPTDADNQSNKPSKDGVVTIESGYISVGG